MGGVQKGQNIDYVILEWPHMEQRFTATCFKMLNFFHCYGCQNTGDYFTLMERRQKKKTTQINFPLIVLIFHVYTKLLKPAFS